MKVKCKARLVSSTRIADRVEMTLHIKYDSLEVNVAGLLVNVGCDYAAINEVLDRLVAAQDVVVTIESVEEGSDG